MLGAPTRDFYWAQLAAVHAGGKSQAASGERKINNRTFVHTIVNMMMRCVQVEGRSAYLADTARVTGEVVLGEGVSVWPSAVIRGDVAEVTVGARSNIQDNATVHCDSGHPNTIGERVTIGHNAVVHGRAVGDGSLIGMHATVLGATVIGKRCLIAAGALVVPGLQVPDDHVVMGVPGKVARETGEKEKQYLAWLADHYVALAERYVNTPNDPNLRPYGEY